jgi:cell division protein FtsZ
MSPNPSTRFRFDSESKDIARIKVIGVGGGGGNAIANMMAKGLNTVEYIALNTDAQALKLNPADLTIQVGASLTQGLGAGARPEVGREAVEENRHQIEEAIDGADMVFITAGMGGGTGTGGAPVVASIAKRKGILTVGVVTTPFTCEGRVRMRYATEGINELKKNCDTVIVIPNERLMDLCGEDTSLVEAFDLANEVLYNATRGISDLIVLPGLVNLDFADVRTTMQDGGAAIMGSGSATGPDRAELAARAAINSPLLDGISIRGARNVLVNISAGSNLRMKETHTATSLVQQEAGMDAEIIMGTVLDETYGDELRVTVIATGFELNERGVRPQTQAPVSSAAPATGMPVMPTLPGMLPKSPTLGTPGIRRTFTGEPGYKGEANLKALDQPAITRRTALVTELKPKALEQTPTTDAAPVDETVRKFAFGGERIAKGNSDQPAFLRKIMD